ncbi:Cyclin-dependent kinase A-1 [Tritrichomonas foetus]|uniref:cyclin-dependent kinase n=1 Tax=Tritrichomonas foetus TaxID=1144522 RepID=A0A1J4K679_9EUKA|nr:Cyclin-dependent kinase A-1 [Tritrichomonas foetus]|eukprot:OHT05198.1 Cyclin-dependent kinase A-1 [Tritrichomonas foetus]
MSFNNYTKAQKLGEGTYGAVFRATNNETNEPVALKLVRMDQEDDGIPATSLREISILQSTNHTNIIRLQEIICEEGRLTMVFDFMDRDLRHFIDRQRKIPQPLLYSYSFQLLCGIYYLHKNGIIHRDIRPENLLINKAGFLKIGDFGNARVCHRPFASFDGNDSFVWYYAPELLFPNHPYDFPVDLWSCGCAIAEMARSKSLFNGDSQIDQMNQIIKTIGMPTAESWPDFQEYVSSDFPLPTQVEHHDLKVFFPPETDPLLLDLISKLLTMNPKKRLTAEQAVHHPFFKDIPLPLREYCLESIK